MLAAQAGCIPFRPTSRGAQVALITSRRSRRWVIPKGIMDPGEHSWQTAAREAFEEAGLSGRVTAAPIGRYTYRKYGEPKIVAVHLLRVDDEADRWPESSWRARHWMSVTEAAVCVREPSLTRLILTIAHLAGL